MARCSFGLIPSAAEVWKDRLPAGPPAATRRHLEKLAEETGASRGSATPPWLLTPENPSIYRTDHHWTSLGAFYGANALLDALGIEPLKGDDFTPQIASTDFNGTLYSTSGVHWLTPGHHRILGAGGRPDGHHVATGTAQPGHAV